MLPAPAVVFTRLNVPLVVIVPAPVIVPAAPTVVNVTLPLPLLIVPVNTIAELVAPLPVNTTAPVVVIPVSVMVPALLVSVSDTDAGLFVTLDIDTAAAVSAVIVTADVVFNDIT